MRKLAIACCAFSLAIFAANYILPLNLLIPFSLVCAAASVALFIKKTRGFIACRILLLSAALGFICFFVHARLTVVPAAELSGKSGFFTARVMSVPYRTENYDSVELRLADEDLPRIRILLYDYYRCTGELKPGQLVRLEAKLKRADLRWGESYDAYNARDIYLTANTLSRELEITDSFSLDAVPLLLGKAVADTVDRIFPADTSPFMKALLTGDRSDYYADISLKTAMSYSGFSHVIAVSGMHVAFLVGFITLLFGKNVRSSIICIALVWLFTAATGAAPSTVRAAVMQTLLLSAPLFKRENDELTSLSAALALILAINPFSASSISLQLSFAAMGGILCFGEKLFQAINSLTDNKTIRRFLSYPAGVAASSLSVLIFTAPIMAINFGYLSILSPVTNILAVWAVTVCFCGGYIACLLSLIPCFGELTAKIVSWFARYIFTVVKAVSAVPHSVLFFENRYAAFWLVCFYILLLWALASKKRTGKKLVGAFAASAAVLALIIYLPYKSYKSDAGTMAVIDVGQGQSLAILSGEKTILVDCGSTGSIKNAGDTAASYLKSRGRERIDLLVLTHLHKDHANGVETLMELLQIDLLMLPKDCDDTDSLLNGIIDSAQKHNTEIVYIDSDTKISCGRINGIAFAPLESGDTNERCLTLRISIESYDMLVTADIAYSAEIELAEKYNLYGTELLVVGHHGSKYSSCRELLDALGGSTAVISVGYNSYGHPADEVLERLGEYGYNVYRTDTDGTVELRFG